MNKKNMRILVEAGAIKKLNIVARGSCFYVEAMTPHDTHAAETGREGIRTWAKIDAAAKWVRSIGIGKATLILDQWQPAQHEISLAQTSNHSMVQENKDV
ncbi:MAG: hypothetical protein KUG75_11325 [Pseudomonadales bacterium]|nr:hypothetical protein [Pseudomonadales bacterium]